jgi:hypothetical protein
MVKRMLVGQVEVFVQLEVASKTAGRKILTMLVGKCFKTINWDILLHHMHLFYPED